MKTDWKAFCAEIVKEWERVEDGEFFALAPLMDIIRTALAQQEPVGPTDEDIKSWQDQCADLTQLGEVNYSWAFDLRNDEVAGVVRAALQRWGRPAITPISVSERLPEAADCDASFQCWWFTPSEEKWIFWPIKWASPECSHWLPAHALPLPLSEGGAT
jgi:hypothetical protein